MQDPCRAPGPIPDHKTRRVFHLPHLIDALSCYSRRIHAIAGESTGGLIANCLHLMVFLPVIATFLACACGCFVLCLLVSLPEFKGVFACNYGRFWLQLRLFLPAFAGIFACVCGYFFLRLLVLLLANYIMQSNLPANCRWIYPRCDSRLPAIAGNSVSNYRFFASDCSGIYSCVCIYFCLRLAGIFTCDSSVFACKLHVFLPAKVSNYACHSRANSHEFPTWKYH